MCVCGTVKCCGHGAMNCGGTVCQSVRIGCDVPEWCDGVQQWCDGVRQCCEGVATKWRSRATTDRKDRIILVNTCDFFLNNVFLSAAWILLNKNWN